MSIADIKQKIAQTEAALATAREDLQKAVAAAMGNREDAALKRAAMAREDVAFMEDELKLHHIAFNAAVDAAKSAEGKAVIKKRKDLAKAFEESKNDEVALAQVIHQAAQAHTEAVRRYVAQRAESRAIAQQYLELADLDVDTMLRIGAGLNTTSSDVLTAFARQIYALVRAFDHDGLAAFVPTNHYGPGHAPSPETFYDVMLTANNAACATLAHAEDLLSPDYTPPKPAEAVPILPTRDTAHKIAKDWNDLMQHFAQQAKQSQRPQDEETTTVARNWPEYLAATAGLESPHIEGE